MMGGDLTVIRDGRENEVVRDIRRRFSFSAWMGLKRSGGDFIWTDGSRLTYSNWWSGQPRAGLDCVLMSAYGLW